eukprot:m.233388 g.233388  ORF g.233388 m.233388 type:complete len:224 (+) comp19119_c0_seq1:22-693(+)
MAQLARFWRTHSLALDIPKGPFPGLESCLSPQNRANLTNRLKTLQRRDLSSLLRLRAAVLVPLCTVMGQPSVLFTLRSASLRRHSGEVSFPGGMMDEGDVDIVATAVRECQEEIGARQVDVMGLWHDVINKDRTVAVTPVVAWLGEVDINQFTPSASEVQEIFTIDIPTLVVPANRTFYLSSYGTKMPVFNGGKHRVWGLTAYVLAGLLNGCFLPNTPSEQCM